MKRPAFKFSAISVPLLVLCVACSSGDGVGIDVKTSWLGPLRQYERVSGEDNFGVFVRKSEIRPARVARLVVAPAEITISARSDLNSLSPEAYEQLRSAFSKTLAQHIAKRFPAPAGTESAGTESTDGDVYVLRAALTNLTVKRRTKRTGPAGLNDLEFRFGDSVVEIGIYERRSNTRRAVIVQKVPGGNVRWNGMNARFNAFAEKASASAVEARDRINKEANRPEAPALKTAPSNK